MGGDSPASVHLYRCIDTVGTGSAQGTVPIGANLSIGRRGDGHRKGQYRLNKGTSNFVGTGLAPVRKRWRGTSRTRLVEMCHHFSDRGQPCPYGGESAYLSGIDRKGRPLATEHPVPLSSRLWGLPPSSPTHTRIQHCSNKGGCGSISTEDEAACRS